MADVIDSGSKTVLVERDNQYRGLEGKDAAFLGAHFSAQADRHIVDVVRDEGRHGIDTTHTTTKAVELAVEKTAAANALAIATAELRLSKEVLKEACETREVVHKEGEKTRWLIQDNELASVRDQLAQTRSELLALKVQVGLPASAK